MDVVRENGAACLRPPTPPPDTPQLRLGGPISASVPIPNKRLLHCPTGPAPSLVDRSSRNLSTPPESPPSKDTTFENVLLLRSLPKLSDQPPVYAVQIDELATALGGLAEEHFPDSKLTFPWLHGLHVENQVQTAFFAARQSLQRDTPRCFNWITIVKCGGDLSSACLKGAVSPDDILHMSDLDDVSFLDVNPKDGFGIRNFQIQAAKIATVSDIVVYRDQNMSPKAAREMARRCAFAQDKWRREHGSSSDDSSPVYRTLLLSEPFEDIERSHPQLVAVDRRGTIVPSASDFALMEREEMYAMTTASEISQNVWLGPTPNQNLGDAQDEGSEAFNILIETTDLSPPPDVEVLNRVEQNSSNSQQSVEFPSSGSILPQSWPKDSMDPLSAMCQWIYTITHHNEETDRSIEHCSEMKGDDIPMRDLGPGRRKVLLHCVDGYTETTLLAIAYIMYAERKPLHEAILYLHNQKKRNFFAYPSDMILLQSLQHTLMTGRQRRNGARPRISNVQSPSWLSRMDGSLPSRVLPYLYLGNLVHANNPDLIKALNIGQILSIGEPVSWIPKTQAGIPQVTENIMFVDRIQDNGIDSLAGEIDRCLDFIARGKAKGKATLVHCRVGVSRSATICIAEVMLSTGLSFPQAYCFVRARRLNVIIQPHLLFVYELMKFDEKCRQRRGEKPRREMEWTHVCREIAKLNKPYCSR